MPFPVQAIGNCIKIELFLFVILMFVGCTFTAMTGYVDPTYKNYRLCKVIVYIDGAMLGEMLEAEDDIIDQLKKYDISSIKYSSIVPSTRDTPKFKMQCILKSGCNSLFFQYPYKKYRTRNKNIYWLLLNRSNSHIK